MTVMMICAGFQKFNIIMHWCMVKNTVKSIQAELEESNNTYKNAVH